MPGNIGNLFPRFAEHQRGMVRSFQSRPSGWGYHSFVPRRLVAFIYNSEPDRTHVELIDIMESPSNRGSVLFGGVMCYVKVYLWFTKLAKTEFNADASRTIGILWTPYLNGKGGLLLMTEH